MANPIALPGTVVPSGAAVSPGGAQGPSAVSANANNKATLGSDSLVLVQGTAPGVAATTHAQTVSGDDPQLTTLASASTKGLLNQTSGLTTDFIDGTNNSQPLQPVIWSVRLRSFNALGNPTFEVDQRLVVAGLVNPAGNTALFDRWRWNKPGSVTAALNVAATALSGANSVVVPGTNFKISRQACRVTLTTQQASLAAADYIALSQIIEGASFRELINDVSSLSLLVRSSVAGLKFGATISDSPATVSLASLCTIPSANTWTLIQLPNLPVFPAGNFSDAPGVAGYIITICLGAGSTFTTAANGTWQTGNFLAALTQDNFASKATSSTFEVAFIQHEPGATCTTPIDCPFTQNYDACLRYYCKSYDHGTAPGTVITPGRVSFIAPTALTSNPMGSESFPKPMAKSPTFTAYSDATGTVNTVRDQNAGADKSVSSVTGNSRRINQVNLAAAATAGGAVTFHYTADTGW